MLLWIANPSVSMTSFAQPELHNDLIQFLVGMFVHWNTSHMIPFQQSQLKDNSTKQSEQQAPTNGGKELSIHKNIFCEMTQVLKEEQDQRKNTGANLAVTWKCFAPGSHDIACITTLTANAEIAAGQHSLMVSEIWCCFPVISHPNNIHWIKVINRHWKLLTQDNTLRAIELADALVRAQTAMSTWHTQVWNVCFCDYLWHIICCARYVIYCKYFSHSYMIHCNSNRIGNVLPEWW